MAITKIDDTRISLSSETVIDLDSLVRKENGIKADILALQLKLTELKDLIAQARALGVKTAEEAAGEKL